MCRYVVTHLFAAIRGWVRARITASGIHPDDIADAVQLRRRYRKAVSTLPDVQRTVFSLHRVDDLSIAEIAARLHISTPEVEQHLAAALLAIATAVDAPR